MYVGWALNVIVSVRVSEHNKWCAEFCRYLYAATEETDYFYFCFLENYCQACSPWILLKLVIIVASIQRSAYNNILQINVRVGCSQGSSASPVFLWDGKCGWQSGILPQVAIILVAFLPHPLFEGLTGYLGLQGAAPRPFRRIALCWKVEGSLWWDIPIW